MSRPGVSVIVPFADDVGDGRRLLEALATLRTAPGDEVIVVDNAPEPSIEEPAGSSARVVRAAEERSSYYARNAGAAIAAGEWLLFTDSDCRPLPDLLDLYFDPSPEPECGAMAGEIVGDPAQDSLAGRWARATGRLSQRRSLDHPYRGYGSTANLLVRRRAFEELGGFAEGIRSGGDADLCWRLQAAGWTLAYRADACVTHRHRDTLRELLRQDFRYGSSQAWLEVRFPDLPPGRPRGRTIVAILAGAGALLLRGRPEQARLRAIDGLSLLARAAGRRASNRPRAPLSGV